MSAKLTPWFSPDTPPVHVGWYHTNITHNVFNKKILIVDHNFSSETLYESTYNWWWDGEYWRGAEDERKLPEQRRYWRGLAEKPAEDIPQPLKEAPTPKKDIPVTFKENIPLPDKSASEKIIIGYERDLRQLRSLLVKYSHANQLLTHSNSLLEGMAKNMRQKMIKQRLRANSAMRELQVLSKKYSNLRDFLIKNEKSSKRDL